jgi:hypothetical protein
MELLADKVQRLNFTNISASVDPTGLGTRNIKSDGSNMADNTAVVIQFGYKLNCSGTSPSPKVMFDFYLNTTHEWSVGLLINQGAVGIWTWNHNDGYHNSSMQATLPNNWYWVRIDAIRVTGGSILRAFVWDNPAMTGTPVKSYSYNSFYTVNKYVAWAYMFGSNVHGSLDLTPIIMYAPITHGLEGTLAWDPSHACYINTQVSAMRGFALSLQDVIKDDYSAYLDSVISDSVNTSHPKSGSATTSGPGSPGYTYPTSGTIGDKLKTAFEDWASSFDGALTFPHFNYSLPYPFNGLADILNSIMNEVSNTLENVSDGIIYGAEGALISTAKLIDDIIAKIQIEIARVPTWIHKAITVNTYDYWDLTPLVNLIYSSTELVIPDGFQEPLLGITPPDGSFTFPDNTFMIPRHLTFTIFPSFVTGISYTLNLVDIVFSFIPPGIRNGIFPTSTNWPGRRSGDVRKPTFLTDYTGVGVPITDAIGAANVYGGGLVGIGILAYFAPNLAQILLSYMFKLTSSAYNSMRQPSLKDIALAIKPQSDYDSHWHPSGAIAEEILLNNDSRLPSSGVLAKKDDVDFNLSETKSSYKRLYTMGKLVAKHKEDLLDIATLINEIPITGSIDAITGLVDSMITTDFPDDTQDSQQVDSLEALATSINQNVLMVQGLIGLRMV